MVDVIRKQTEKNTAKKQLEIYLFCDVNCRVIFWLFVFDIYTLRVGMVALKAIISPYIRTLLLIYTSSTFLHAATTMNIFDK